MKIESKTCEWCGSDDPRIVEGYTGNLICPDCWDVCRAAIIGNRTAIQRRRQPARLAAVGRVRDGNLIVLGAVKYKEQS